MVERQHGTARTHSDDPITSEDERYELLDGKPSRARLRTAERHHVVGPLRTFVDVFAIKFDLGSVLATPTTVELSETNVTRPDVAFVSRERENILAEGVVGGAPDLVVEVFTPSVEKSDNSNRRGIYARHGVKEYWQVDADIPEVSVWLLGNKEYELAGRYEPGQALTSPTLRGLCIVVGGPRNLWISKIVFPEDQARFDYADYQRTPDDERYELLDGTLSTRD